MYDYPDNLVIQMCIKYLPLGKEQQGEYGISPHILIKCFYMG